MHVHKLSLDALAHLSSRCVLSRSERLRRLQSGNGRGARGSSGKSLPSRHHQICTSRTPAVRGLGRGASGLRASATSRRGLAVAAASSSDAASKLLAPARLLGLQVCVQYLELPVDSAPQFTRKYARMSSNAHRVQMPTRSSVDRSDPVRVAALEDAWAMQTDTCLEASGRYFGPSILSWNIWSLSGHGGRSVHRAHRRRLEIPGGRQGGGRRREHRAANQLHGGFGAIRRGRRSRRLAACGTATA